MVKVFNERKKGFEAKFKMDEEMEFKVSARRNKLLGLWLKNSDYPNLSMMHTQPRWF